MADARGALGELSDELAEVFYEPATIELLLARAGFPREMWPAFTAPAETWNKVIHSASKGACDGGPRAIAEQALRMMPSNQIFQKHGHDQEALNGVDAVARQPCHPLACVALVLSVGAMLIEIWRFAPSSHLERAHGLEGLEAADSTGSRLEGSTELGPVVDAQPVDPGATDGHTSP